MLLLDELQALFDSGGVVLHLIVALAVLMWFCIFERLLYLLYAHRRLTNRVSAYWAARSEHSSWQAQQIRLYLISLGQQGLEKNLSLILVSVTLAPLLGLLGTVTGMIEVFEAMTQAGFGNVRAVASGISRATIPTMAGMLVAISGLAVSLWLQRRVGYLREQLDRQLQLDL